MRELADEAIPWSRGGGEFSCADGSHGPRSNADDMLMLYAAAASDDSLRAARFFERAGIPLVRGRIPARLLDGRSDPVDIVLTGSRRRSQRQPARGRSGGISTRTQATLKRCRAPCDSARAHPAGRAITSRVRAVLCSRHRLAVRSRSGEMLAGDAAAAEAILGPLSSRPTPARTPPGSPLTAFRAVALVELDRFDEALRLVDAARVASLTTICSPRSRGARRSREPTCERGVGPRRSYMRSRRLSWRGRRVPLGEPLLARRGQGQQGRLEEPLPLVDEAL